MQHEQELLIAVISFLVLWLCCTLPALHELCCHRAPPDISLRLHVKWCQRVQ